MKLLINDKYVEVGFWSFTKCTILTQLALTGITYGILLLFFLLILFGGLG